MNIIQQTPVITQPSQMQVPMQQQTPQLMQQIPMQTSTDGQINSSVNATSGEESDSSLYTYILIGLGVIIFIILAWYIYSKFTENACKDDDKAEKDENIMDYNLREEIQKLEQMQRNILKKVSADPGI